MSATEPLWLLFLLIFLAGFVGKLGDGHIEHGLDFFPGAGLFFASLGGLLWGYVMTRSPVLMTGFMGLVFFWTWKLTWDHHYHAVCLIIILCFALNSDYRMDTAAALAICTAHALSHWLKNHPPTIGHAAHALFYRFRLDFLLILLIYALMAGPEGMVGYSCFLGTVAANWVFCIPKAVVARG
ncbi:MAG: hypothetical protein WC256_00030 [Desulfurivibrionaceae bacterium]|jgi:hypothetical protein